MPRLYRTLGKKVDHVVRIVLALLSLLTAHGPARAGQARTPSGPAWRRRPVPRPDVSARGRPTAVLAGPGGPAAPTAPPAGGRSGRAARDAAAARPRRPPGLAT